MIETNFESNSFVIQTIKVATMQETGESGEKCQSIDIVDIVIDHPYKKLTKK